MPLSCRENKLADISRQIFDIEITRLLYSNWTCNCNPPPPSRVRTIITFIPAWGYKNFRSRQTKSMTFAGNSIPTFCLLPHFPHNVYEFPAFHRFPIFQKVAILSTQQQQFPGQRQKVFTPHVTICVPPFWWTRSQPALGSHRATGSIRTTRWAP